MSSLPLWAHGLIVLVTIGVVALGAHWLVEAASRIAKRFGVSELIIGLTIVAMGTAAPEFAVTLIAALRDQGDISVGNIVGSNIFNLGFILGGCAVVRAIPIGRTMLQRDGAVLGATTVLIGVLIGFDLELDRHDGLLLCILLVAYLAFLFKQRRKGIEEEPSPDTHAPEKGMSLWREGAALLIGLLCIVAGSHLLVASATAIARGFGVSEWVIGVTIVAAGTSAPELATSLVGVIKGRYAMSAGNVIGSDIFNLLGVLGLAGILRPMSVDSMARVSLAALCGMVFLVIFFMRTGWRVSRLEGLALIAIAASRWIVDLSARGVGL